MVCEPTPAPRSLRLTDVAGVAEYMDDTVRHVRSLVAARSIPYIKVGHYIRFDLDEVDAWLNEHRIRPVG